MNAPVNSSSQCDGNHAATASDGMLAEETSKRSAPKSKRASSTVHAQIITSLQRVKRVSRADLCAELDVTPEVVKRFLDELRDLGAVYVAQRLRFSETQTNLTEMFALNPTPFQNPDAPRPPDSRNRRKEKT